MKLTKQRLSLVSAFSPGSTLTLRQILAALGMNGQVPRRDYIRVHQFVRGFVKQGLIKQNMVPRHGQSTFTLTSKGEEVAASLLKAYDAKVRKILAWNAPISTKFRTAPTRPALVSSLTEQTPTVVMQHEPLIPPLRCPNCGRTTRGAEAQAMIRAGQKVRCQCNYNLTALAWAAMEGR